MKVLEMIEKEKLVAILRLQNTKSLKSIVSSLYDGGIRILEITMNTPHALETIQQVKTQYPDMVVGAGTVLDGSSAREAIHAGADFMLAPTLKEETIQTGNRYGIPVIPGVFTPTEVLTAYEYGASLVKVFPATQVNARYLKDLKGPMPFINGMAVGGISSSNLDEYLNKGWHSVGLGSALVHPTWVEQEEFNKIEEAARELVAIRDQVFKD
ncbi:bifunctional 4-hydroxy-2-oxoglutarate aldolase/2-dehydro-3-deoxy-phosphogluconate aldolase [Halobacillus halophilus]|uniref:bifunctional 4-hydroxy-2-oxoglutarate aldolase/2-dehydro-3-deoxy-phosphogluconate aldolase n=1 Tax=Halobacillus halophilus TaxID=1570 RepID=UPI001CD1AE7E|nr:bifunctional 4-hydroxy-2-oxoglutarate aldolase/2-dehydro-3-deoxy-phosphogluconate aldolase [Halobacillus halophilus]MCA1011978.1 bifunctional 4-hydroxy-2-oxoglutarate aldolase/2-dehydro-3-deoxy-phosphogluconate aldolase [Halobacillus halophilus]